METPNNENLQDPNQPTQENVDQITTTSNVNLDVSPVQNALNGLKQEIAKVIIGQEEVLTLCFASMIIGGHVLIEGVPGVAKTLMAKSMAKALNLDFSRIQFTPDLMPADVTGTSIFNLKNAAFEFVKGPVFTQVLLIDEINRSPAKTQASLFEVMEEKQVTNDNKTYQLDLPFFVMATQNPVEQEGTYQLPEAQLDRFLFKIIVQLPVIDEEIEILKRYQEDFAQKQTKNINAILTQKVILACQDIIQHVKISEQILKYISQIVVATREHPDIYLGGSPRASLNIMKASKCIAALNGRNFVTPDDVKYVSSFVLNHRLILQPEREMAGVHVSEIMDEIFTTIEVPR